MWEYKTEIINAKGVFSSGKFHSEELDQKLNEMGKLGWELVNIATSNKGYGESRALIAVFKRPIKSER